MPYRANAQNSLGGTYEQGSGVNRDYIKARKWYEKSAAQGNADAQYCLCNMYEQELCRAGKQKESSFIV